MDFILLGLMILIMGGVPFGIWAYDHMFQSQKIPRGAKEFTLTGNTQRGWLLGDVQAHDIISLRKKNAMAEHPVIKVSKGDQVVLKLRSSDVLHGFTLKAYDIYISEGIGPGKTVFASFTADEVGTFYFWCNVFCGDIHQHMTGTLVVTE